MLVSIHPIVFMLRADIYVDGRCLDNKVSNICRRLLLRKKKCALACLHLSFVSIPVQVHVLLSECIGVFPNIYFGPYTAPLVPNLNFSHSLSTNDNVALPQHRHSYWGLQLLSEPPY